jgi:large subunit ribosomal protein L4
VVDALEMDKPKTREFSAALDRLAVADSTLILLSERNEAVEKSARNIPNVKTLRASYLNIRDLLGHDTLVIPLDSLDVIQTILG